MSMVTSKVRRQATAAAWIPRQSVNTELTGQVDSLLAQQSNITGVSEILNGCLYVAPLPISCFNSAPSRELGRDTTADCRARLYTLDSHAAPT